MGLVPRERKQIYLGRGALEVFAVGEISLSLLKKKKRIFIDDERTDATVFSSRFFDKGNREGTRIRILRTRVM